MLLATAGFAANYHVVDTIQVGGEGGWDYLYVDTASNRLFLSHATKVVVVDLATNKVAGEIADTPGVHGVAIATKLNRGFVSAGRANSVKIFDLKTLQPIGDVKTGQNPDAIQYEPTTDRVFTFNGRSKDSTVIDAKTGTVLSTIPLGGKPEFAADAGGKLYVNIEDTAEIAEIDAAKMAVTKRYKLEGCEEPSGLAMDVKGRRIFSVCGNKVMIVSDPDSGKVVAKLPIGDGADGAAYDPGTGNAFSSNGADGTLTVVKKVNGKYEVAETGKTAKGARTITVDPKTHKLYLPTAEFVAPTGSGRPAVKPGTFKVLVMSE
jgi:YVTN family beta-propeller protein